MSFHFIKSGLQTSIQDLGRTGLMHLGISQSGAMDTNSMKLANWLVNKPLDSAVIEVTLIGPTIRIKKDISLAVCGAQFDLYLNNNQVSNNQMIEAKRDDILTFGRLHQGARAYLAFSGKLELTKILNSHSTHLTAMFGGFKNRQLIDNDVLEISSFPLSVVRKLPEKFNMHYPGSYLIRCVESVESDKFNAAQKERFFSQTYKVTSDSNRMGIRLLGEAMEFDTSFEIASTGLTQGSIQIPPSGQAIISSVDGQTIGGYPRIANIITADLPRLGQLKAGDKVNFVMVNLSLALKILCDSQHWQNQLIKESNPNL